MNELLIWAGAHWYVLLAAGLLAVATILYLDFNSIGECVAAGFLYALCKGGDPVRGAAHGLLNSRASRSPIKFIAYIVAISSAILLLAGLWFRWR